MAESEIVDALSAIADGRRSAEAVARQLRDELRHGRLGLPAVMAAITRAASHQAPLRRPAEQLLQALHASLASASATDAPTTVRPTGVGPRADAARTEVRPTGIGRAPSASAEATVVAPLTVPESGSAARAGEAATVVVARAEAGTVVHATTPTAPVPIRPGSGLWTLKGRFDLQEMIGSGGMGVVYSAIDRIKADAGDPNHWVAIKLLNTDLQHFPAAFTSLQREASKAQALAHPNIATVYDFDKDGDSAFISMELLKGQPLASFIRGLGEQGLPRKQALPIVLGIAEGLAYAHRKGIVHSDLKPANVFLMEDGTAKLLDFGIARSVPTAGGARSEDSFDAGSLNAYTAAYATEEMIRGADPAACDDLYALGIIAYELLAGRHPYDRESAPAARQNRRVPAPLKALKRGEWKVIAASLSFARADRPRDAGDFIRRFNRDSRRLKTLAALAAVVLLSIAGLAYQHYRDSGPAVALEDLPAATQAKVRESLDYGDKAWAFYRKDGIADGLMTAIDAYEAADVLHPRDRAATHGLRRAADALLKLTAHDPALQVEAARSLAERSKYLATYDPVKTVLDRAGPAAR